MEMNRREALLGMSGIVGSLMVGNATAATPTTIKHALPSELIEAIKEKSTLYGKWSRYFKEAFNVDMEKPETWLPGFDTVTLLENQRMINEYTTDTGDSAQFKRISISLVIHVYTQNYVGRELVNSWAMIKPIERPWWYDTKNGFTTTNEEIPSDWDARITAPVRDGHEFRNKYKFKKLLNPKTTKFDTLWAYEKQQDLRASHSLEKEAELTAVLAQCLGSELSRRIIRKIRKNKDVHKIYAKNFNEGTEKASEAIEASTGHKPNWLIAHPETLKTCNTWIALHDDYIQSVNKTPFNEFAPMEFVTRIGTLNDRYKVFSDRKMPKSEILMGYKGDKTLEDQFSGGVTHGIYIPFTQTPLVLDPVTWQPRKGLLVRHDIRWRENGGKYYARVQI